MDVLFSFELDLDQFVFLAADAKLYRMVDAAHPVGFRMVVLEMIVVHMGLLTQTAVSNHRLLVVSVRTGNIQCNRVKGCKHTYIRYDRRIIFGVAIAAGRNIHNQTDMEMGTILQHSQRILCNLTVEDIVGLILRGLYSINRANADAATAADTLIVINGCLFVCNRNGTMGANLLALTAANALLLLHIRLTGRCISILPAREPQPIPRFFSAPPKPVAS